MQWVGGSFGLAVMTAVFAATTGSLGSRTSAAEVFAHGAAAALTVGVVLAIGVLALAVGVLSRRPLGRGASAAPGTSSASGARTAHAAPETTPSV